jgi:hypothetical protein
MKLKSLLIGAAVAGISTAALASGYYGQNGSLGQATWPSPNTTSGTLPLSGNESWVVDTQLPNGQNPASEYISAATLGNYLTAGPGGSRNALIGGDFTTNLFQRGTSVTGISNTVTYGPDRWFAVGGASSAISLLKETTNLPLAPNNQFGASLRVSQVSTTDTAVVNFGQVVSTSNSLKFVGNTAVLSFWAKKGSAAPTTFTATINSGTGTDGSAANMVAAGWTGEVSNSCTITPTTSWARYTCSYPIASTMKQVGVSFSFTPTGISSTNQWFEFAGIQLEAATQSASWAALGNYLFGETVVSNGNLYSETATSCTAASTAPSGTANFVDGTCTWKYVSTYAVPVVASGFDFRSAGLEQVLQQQYYWEWDETASATTDSPFLCVAQSTTVAVCKARAAVNFRVAPTITCTFGTLKRMVAGTDTALTACAAAATTNGVSDVNEVTITATVAAGDTAGFAGTLMSGNSTGGGKITASAEY